MRLEGERAALSQQLAAERSRLGCYEAKWREQEREICDLKSLTVDLKAQLNHGLANLGTWLLRTVNDSFLHDGSPTPQNCSSPPHPFFVCKYCRQGGQKSI